jgi:hypothetical protein
VHFDSIQQWNQQNHKSTSAFVGLIVEYLSVIPYAATQYNTDVHSPPSPEISYTIVVRIFIACHEDNK